MIDLTWVIARWAFAVEMLLCAIIYLVGPYSFIGLKHLKAECEDLSVAIEQYKDKNVEIEQQIIAWNVCPFYKEKIAREQLHMAHADEIVYTLNSDIR